MHPLPNTRRGLSRSNLVRPKLSVKNSAKNKAIYAGAVVQRGDALVPSKQCGLRNYATDWRKYRLATETIPNSPMRRGGRV